MLIFGTSMVDDEVLDGFEQLVYSIKLHLSPILAIDVFINMVILSELVALEVIFELVELSDGDGSASEDIDELCQFDVAISVYPFELLKVFLCLSLLHRCNYFITGTNNLSHQFTQKHQIYK